MEVVKLEEKTLKNPRGNLDSFYQAFTEHSVIDDYTKTNSFKKIKALRPFSFSLFMPASQHELDNNIQIFEGINYTVQNISSNHIVGIRSDLYSLGFDFGKFEKLLSLPSRKELIKNEINLLLNGDLECRGILSRKDEVEILGTFFE